MRYADAIVTVAAVAALAAQVRTGAVQAGPRAEDWTLVAEDGGAVVRYKDVAVGELSYVFWGPDWSWVDVKKTALPAVAAGERFRLDVAALGLTLEAPVRSNA